MAILEIQGISKSFGAKNIVKNINLEIKQGEFFTLLGPSGCGKTTLLRMIGGFMLPDEGKIFLEGKDITQLPPEKRPLHTIFQSYALFPHFTVFDNVAFPLRMAKWSKDKIVSQVQELLEDVQLTQFADCYPHELSGGQKQRVSIARSLVDRPKILLLDEPLSALDARLREHMHMELVTLQEETGVTFVYVTHDQSEALALSSRIAVMNGGDIEQLDSPQSIYSNPATYFVADFLGNCNLLEAEVLEKNGSQFTLLVAGIWKMELKDTSEREIHIGQKGWYALRPEKIHLGKEELEHYSGGAESSFSAQVVVRGYYYYGVDTLYEFRLENGVLLQAMLGNTRAKLNRFFDEGETVTISFNIQSGRFLTE
jgi:spermidine/putrescine transport system ATP-binding protein